jgi:hypothetical protein
MAEPNYEIDYADERFDTLEAEKTAAMEELDKTYKDLADDVTMKYNQQIDAVKDYEWTQKKNQQDRTDFEIAKINQQKEQAEKDYQKEQSGAYVDWQKQSNQYGVDAEQKASMGMTGTGYSESSQVSMYNTYQNRVATARASFDQAKLNYENLATEARLQNSSALAEIAYNALKEELRLSLEKFSYNNDLILDKVNKKTALNNTYYQRYLDIVDQINTENKLSQQADLLGPLGENGDLLYSDGSNTPDGQIGKGNTGSLWDNIKDAFSGLFDGKSGGSSGGSSGNTSSSNSEQKTMKSIIDLGYGPISEKNLLDKVASGQVKEVVDKDGNLTFKKNQKPGTLTAFGKTGKYFK